MSKKKIALLFLAFFVSFLVQGQSCLSQIKLTEALQRPAVQSARTDIATWTEAWISRREERLETRTTITIPVVFHVVYRTEVENISDEQILSQIAVLNDDFRLMNANQNIIPAGFQNVKADLEIAFALATVDPQGNPTNGITRIQTTQSGIGLATNAEGRRRICYNDLGGKDAWCTGQYLNIWVGDFPQGFAAEASFPGQDLSSEDGIRIDPARLGNTGTVSPPYHLGRTLTHELGHYFNLYHLWGTTGPDNPDCTGSDEVDDTPPQGVSYLERCPTFTEFSCTGADMYQNYLNFTDDACMALFTQGQKERVWATLSGPRASLLEMGSCTVAVFDLALANQVQLFPNPASDQLFITGLPLDQGLWQMTMVNAAGQVVRQEKLPQEENVNLFISSLTPGLYWIKCTSAKKIITKKLIIAQ